MIKFNGKEPSGEGTLFVNASAHLITKNSALSLAATTEVTARIRHGAMPRSALPVGHMCRVAPA